MDESEPKSVLALRGMCKPDVSMAEIAKRVGVSRQMVWAWAEGKSRPSLEHMIALREEYGLEVEGWVKP